MEDPQKIRQMEIQINSLISERNKLLAERSNNLLFHNPSVTETLSELLEAKKQGEVQKFKNFAAELYDQVRTDYSADVQKDPIKDMEKFYSVTPYFEFPKRLGIGAKQKKGNTIILGARPGVGKTKVMTNLVYEDLKEGIPIAVYSLEQNPVDIWISLAQLWLFDNHKLSVSFWTMSDIMNDVKHAAIKAEFDKWVKERLPTIRIINASGYTANDISRSIESVTQQLKAKPEKVYLDYLQIIKRDPNFRGSSKENMDLISHVLTTKCKRMNSVFILLSQLNRVSEDKKTPSLSDFKESGAIEQDAGVAVIIERPLDTDGKPTDEVNFWVVKDRYGGHRGKRVTFIDKQSYFVGVEKEF
jgi:replicative DNA helicase